MSTHLKQLCHTHLPGNKEDSPAEHFAKMAKWCEENKVNHDVYGEGETIHAFEQKVADLLGYEAGLFVVTGTMTQPTVLEIVTRQKRNPIVAMHASSHIPEHEKQGYQLQHRFSVLPVGNVYQTWKLGISLRGRMKSQPFCMNSRCEKLAVSYLHGKNWKKSKLTAPKKTFISTWMVQGFGKPQRIIRKNTARSPLVLIRRMYHSIKALTAWADLCCLVQRRSLNWPQCG